MKVVVGAIQHGESHISIGQYFGHFDEEMVRKRIHAWVQDFPPMSYAVQTNDEKMIRLMAERGGDVHSRHSPSKIPLLAFAVLRGKAVEEDTTQAVITLLALGASAEVFPKAFYSPYKFDLPPGGPPLPDLNDDNKSWCRPLREKLTAALNLSQRYFLDKSTKVVKPSSREKQLTGRRNANALLGIPYFLIGQNPAAALLKDHLLAYMLEDKQNKHPKPLVLIFAGPSGHGRVELAKQLGHLLSLDTSIVDCTVFCHERELFGGRAPWRGYEKGSMLNNFLAKHDGKSSIVFLDEFKKTSTDIRNALLIPFEDGKKYPIPLPL